VDLIGIEPMISSMLECDIGVVLTKLNCRSSIVEHAALILTQPVGRIRD